MTFCTSCSVKSLFALSVSSINCITRCHTCHLILHCIFKLGLRTYSRRSPYTAYLNWDYGRIPGDPPGVEGMFARDRVEREAKRSRETGHYSGARAPAARYGRGFVSRLVHSALPAASGVPAPPRPQEPYYAPPVSSMPPTRGAITGQSSRPGPVSFN